MKNIIIAIVAVIVLVYIGRTLSNRSDTSGVSVETQSQEVGTDVASSTQPKSAPRITPVSIVRSDNQYAIMEVPELGINFPIVKDVKDFKYSVRNAKLYFSRNTYEALSSTCAVKLAPFGKIEKVMKADLESDPNGYWTKTIEGIERAKKNGVVKEFEKFYIVHVAPEDATCAKTAGVSKDFFSFQGITLMNK